MDDAVQVVPQGDDSGEVPLMDKIMQIKFDTHVNDDDIHALCIAAGCTKQRDNAAQTMIRLAVRAYISRELLDMYRKSKRREDATLKSGKPRSKVNKGKKDARMPVVVMLP